MSKTIFFKPNNNMKDIIYTKKFKLLKVEKIIKGKANYREIEKKKNAVESNQAKENRCWLSQGKQVH